MGDLIWIGNTLMPRGTMILFVAIVFIAPFMIGGVMSFIRNRR